MREHSVNLGNGMHRKCKLYILKELGNFSTTCCLAKLYYYSLTACIYAFSFLYFPLNRLKDEFWQAK